MGGHNNQPKVGVDDGRGVGEETLPGRIGTCVGVLSLRSGRRIEREKKSKIKYVVALGGRRTTKSHNNQPKARGRDEGGNGDDVREWGSMQGKDESVVLGTIELGEGKNKIK
jgi:hypothetical protein